MEWPKVQVPRRWWWVVAIALPVGYALVDLSVKLLDVLMPAPERSALTEGVLIQGGQVRAARIVGGNYREGDRIESTFAFTTVTLMAREIATTTGTPPSEEQRRHLEQAMAWIKEGVVDRAIPLLETVAETSPSPSVLNNLATAYWMEGDERRARATLDRVKSTDSASPEAQIAARYNLRRIADAQTRLVQAVGATNATTWDGVVAEVSRLEETGGMLTLEARYWNVGTEVVTIDVDPPYSYLLAEAEGRKLTYADSGGQDWRLDLPPGGHLFVWTKFRTPGELPEHFTVVLHGVPRPFEAVPMGYRQPADPGGSIDPGSR